MELILPILFFAGFFAGLIDTIAGGGGLITVPALLMAGLPPLEALATNKAQAVVGSTSALWRFSRTQLLERSQALLAFGFGFAGSLLGVCGVSLIPNSFLRPVVLVMLLVAASLVLFVQPQKHGEPLQRPRSWAIALALAVGAYDGFFGPGTGTLLILAYVILWRQEFDAASANAKTVNCASNWGALLMFLVMGTGIHWPKALAMATGQFAGAWLGAHLVVKRGKKLVRWIAVFVSLGLAGRLALQLLGK